MPSLDWIGKEAVLDHHREVPFHLLQCDPALSVGDPDAGNLLIEGDNLLALKALLPHYAGKVKCIYIDPPYNTGTENWVYNDKVNSPEIREWLGKVLGAEAADLSRHDKWLCMMYPRVALLRDFLADDGLLFVSIDDNEVARARLLCDEIFGHRRFIATLVWKSRHFTDTRPFVSIDHEYILIYGASLASRLRGKRKDFSKYKNPDGDPRHLAPDPLRRTEARQATSGRSLGRAQPGALRLRDAVRRGLGGHRRRDRGRFVTCCQGSGGGAVLRSRGVPHAGRIHPAVESS